MNLTEHPDNKNHQKFQQRDQVINHLLKETPGLWRASTPTAARPATTAGRSNPMPITGDLFAEQPCSTEQEIRDGRINTALAQRISTGFKALDDLLPAGGWPERGLVELICPHQGIGELQMLLPLLRARSRQKESILWIAPPYTLNTPALQQAGINTRNSFVIPAQTGCNQALWSIEKALQSSECCLVLAWQNWLSARVLRRLQLAASEGGTLGLLFHKRPTAHSPASLQLHLRSPLALINQPRTTRAIEVTLTRARGPYQPGRATIPLS